MFCGLYRVNVSRDRFLVVVVFCVTSGSNVLQCSLTFSLGIKAPSIRLSFTLKHFFLLQCLRRREHRNISNRGKYDPFTSRVLLTYTFMHIYIYIYIYMYMKKE